MDRKPEEPMHPKLGLARREVSYQLCNHEITDFKRPEQGTLDVGLYTLSTE